MPKKVDHEGRRQEIARALWRIAGERGLDGAGLRDVAAEADISLGRLQHYFRTKDEMLVFALRHINELAEARIRARIDALGPNPAPRAVLRICLTGMLPLDEASRTGQRVAAAYHARAVHDPRLREEATVGVPALRDLFADLLRRARERGEVAAGRDPRDEAMTLICLADGLSAYVLLGVQEPEAAVRLLDAHLDRLFTGAPGGGGRD